MIKSIFGDFRNALIQIVEEESILKRRELLGRLESRVVQVSYQNVFSFEEVNHARNIDGWKRYKEEVIVETIAKEVAKQVSLTWLGDRVIGELVVIRKNV